MWLTANSVTLNLLGQLLEHVNLTLTALTLLETLHDLLSPLASLTARCALAATLVAVEVAETADGTDDIGTLVHDDNGGSSETRLAVLEGVEVHQLVVANALGQNGSGRTTWDDGLKVVPATTDTTAVLVNQLTERNGHLLLDSARVVDVSGDTEELGTLVALTTEASEPVTAATANGGSDSHGLDVGNGGRASEETDGSRERRLQARLSGLALERLDQRGLLTADVGTSTTVKEDIEVVAGVTGVLADEPVLVGLVDRVLEDGGFLDEFTTNVDIGSGRVHGSAGDEAALNKLVGVLAHNLAVLACSRLTLVSVHDEIPRLRVLVPILEVHE
jgi:hypothetical protein